MKSALLSNFPGRYTNDFWPCDSRRRRRFQHSRTLQFPRAIRRRSVTTDTGSILVCRVWLRYHGCALLFCYVAWVADVFTCLRLTLPYTLVITALCYRCYGLESLGRWRPTICGLGTAVWPLGPAYLRASSKTPVPSALDFASPQWRLLLPVCLLACTPRQSLASQSTSFRWRVESRLHGRVRAMCVPWCFTAFARWVCGPTFAFLRFSLDVCDGG